MPGIPERPLRPVQRTAAFAVVHGLAGSVVLVRASARSDFPGAWFLPGGGVHHGEHPRDAVTREIREETGLAVSVTGLRAAGADVVDLPHRGVSLHTVRVIYDAVRNGGAASPGDGEVAGDLRPEPEGTSDAAALVTPDELAGLPLMPFAAQALGLPPVPLPAVGAPRRPEELEGVAIDAARAAGLDEPVEPEPAGDRDDGEVAVPFQRPGAYAVLVDGAGRVLLTRQRDSDELWTLPGGGIDHGELPVAALVREVHEETGLPLSPGPLLAVTSRHFVGRAPSGRLEDFHGIRLIHAGTVPAGVAPRVVETNGSTDRVAWIPRTSLGRLRIGETVREGLAALDAGHAR